MNFDFTAASDGENFLVPIDAKFQSENDVSEQGLKLAEVMGLLEAAPSKARILRRRGAPRSTGARCPKAPACRPAPGRLPRAARA